MEDFKQDFLGINDKHGGSFGQDFPMMYIFNRVRVWIEKLLASACKKTTASNKVRFLRCFCKLSFCVISYLLIKVSALKLSDVKIITFLYCIFIYIFTLLYYI